MTEEAKELIELSELRIGNYLLYKGNVVYVTSLSMDIDDEYEDQIGFCKLGETSNEHSAWNRSLYKDLERIPITKDWIISLGLQVNYGYEFAKIFNLYIDLIDDKCLVSLEQYSEGREPLPQIRFVHQLQELFKALMGIELKVKQ
jgi:hypothetical protein